MSNLLLDYAFSFEEVEGTLQPDYSFLSNVAVAVKSNNVSTPPKPLPYLVEVYSPELVKEHTDNETVNQLFSGGLGAFYLLVCETLDSADPLLDDTEFYTFGISDDFDEDAASVFIPSKYAGVVYSTSSTRSDAKTVVAGNITKRRDLKSQFLKSHDLLKKTKDKSQRTELLKGARTAAVDLAKLPHRCCFLDLAYNTSGAHFAFGKLLSAAYWSDQQYIQANADDWWATSQLGEADSLFKDRISFYLSDKQYGTRLAFFAAGGESISAPYINRLVELSIQGAGLNYISINHPRNTVSTRINLESRLQDEVDKYMVAPYYYLDPDGDNDVQLYDSEERYFLNGALAIKTAEPIWRVNFQVKQESY